LPKEVRNEKENGGEEGHRHINKLFRERSQGLERVNLLQLLFSGKFALRVNLVFEKGACGQEHDISQYDVGGEQHLAEEVSTNGHCVRVDTLVHRLVVYSVGAFASFDEAV
jgi:hypothetical protein